MTVLSIREFNANVSKVFARVESGEAIDIMRNGKVIAEIRPKKPSRDEKWWAAYNESVRVLSKGFPGKIGKITEEDKYGDADL